MKDLERIIKANTLKKAALDKMLEGISAGDFYIVVNHNDVFNLKNENHEILKKILLEEIDEKMKELMS